MVTSPNVECGSSVDWAQIPLDDEHPSYVIEKRVGNREGASRLRKNSVDAKHLAGIFRTVLVPE